MVAKTTLKYGGLLMSSILTIALFLDLFRKDGELYSWIMAGSALALFEGGALLWNHLIDEARGAQRPIAKGGLWICVSLSLISSCLQIIMSTTLIRAQFDTGEAALWTIAIALAVNVTFIIGFELLDPDRFELNQDQDHAAKTERKKHQLVGKIISLAHTKANARVDEISGQVSEDYAEYIKQMVVAYMISRTPPAAQGAKPPTPVPTVLPKPPATPKIEDSPASRLKVLVGGRGSRNGTPIEEIEIVPPPSDLDNGSK